MNSSMSTKKDRRNTSSTKSMENRDLGDVCEIDTNPRHDTNYGTLKFTLPHHQQQSKNERNS